MLINTFEYLPIVSTALISQTSETLEAEICVEHFLTGFSIQEEWADRV